MTTHIKLRPLMVHDSASSQSGFSEACALDSSPPIRAHCSLPSANSRGAKLVPAPPDAGSASVAEDTGVSKLRSKLRRLLGAHSNSSSSQGASAQKAAATPSQTAALRCASTADLNDRPSTSSHGGGRAAASVPVSPSVAAASAGARGRFAGSNIMVPNSVASTPPATPGSVCSTAASPACLLTTSRPSPIPPVTAAPVSGGAGASGGPTARCPSANSGRSPSLRRAVSFSPTATTFPPLGSPSIPTPPSAAPTSGSGSGSGMVMLGSSGPTASSGVTTRPGITSSNSFVAGGGRGISSMVVVPEDEALQEDAAQSDHWLTLSAGSIVATPPLGPGARGSAGHANEHIFRNGRVSAPDPDTPPPALASPPPPAAVQLQHPDAAAYVTTHSLTGVAATGGPMMPRAPPPLLPSPCGHDAQQRTTSSSSSSSVVLPTANVYADGGGGGPMGPHTMSAPAPLASTGLTSWSSEASATHGSFQGAAAAAAMAFLEPPASPALSTSSSSYSHQLPYSQQQLRTPPLKPVSRGGGGGGAPGSDPGRPPSGSSSSVGASAVSAPPRGTAFQPHPHLPLPAALSGGSPAVASAQPLPNHTSVPPPPPLTRGMSAVNLMAAASGGGGGSRGAGSMPSPWNAVGAAAAATASPTPASALPPAAMAALEAPSTPAANPTAAAAAVSKNPPIRRAHSTIDNGTRSTPESVSGPPGVLMALGASLPTEMKRQDWRVEDFTMLKRLYKGNYSAVHKALCRISMRLVVIKTYDTTRMTELARNHVKREATLHAPLEHDNILNLYAVFVQGPYVMLVEEVAEGGDLYHVLKSIPGHRLQEDRAVAGVLVPLLRALSYLHEQGICHRDIKLENILFSDRQHTRMLLADFGIALSLRQERAVTRAGTTEYMSPEQLRCPFKRHPADNKDRADLHYGLGVDVWATGVLAFELLHGYPPFLGAHREDTEHLILTAEVQVAPQLSHGARDFVLSCLQKDPADRPTVMQLLQHAWVRQHMRQLR